jgi:oxalate oxidoreductase subunit delta
MDDTIIKGINIVRGMKEGGAMVVNTKRSAEELLALIPEKNLLKYFVTVDATGIIGGSGLDSVDFMGSEGGTEAVSVAVGLAAPLVGAATKICDKFSLENVVACAGNKGAVKEGAKTAVVKSL